MNKNLFSISKLPVTIIKQGKRFVAYSPALDLSTCGKTLKEVRGRFSEVVSIFLEEIIEAGTEREVLAELGWTKIKDKWNPPRVISSSFVGVALPKVVS